MVQANILGNPTPTVKWFCNELPIIDEPESEASQSYDNGVATLTHTPKHAASDTEITVEVENSMGKAVGKILHNVEEEATHANAPHIVLPLSAQIVKTNSTLKLEVKYTGTPTPEVVWTRNNATVEPGEDVLITTKAGKTPVTSSALVIRMMQRSKGGKFEVVARNKHGEAKSSASVLVCDLKESPDIVAPRFVIPLKSRAACLGEVIILEALVQSTPNCTFEWTCHGKTVKVSNDLRIVTHDNKSIMIVKKLKKLHEGHYTCRAENLGGSVTSSANIRIKSTGPSQFSPRFVRRLQPILICEAGNAIDLRCQEQSEPKGSVTWLKDGESLEGNQRTLIAHESDGTCLLRILNGTVDDCGTYACVAHNSLGESVTSCQVLVEGTFHPSIS